MTVNALAQPDDSLIAQPECAEIEGSWCDKIYEATDITWLARVANEVITSALAIALILAVAIVARLVLHRLINRFANRLGSGRRSSRLRAWRTDRRTGADGRPAGSDAEERRSQRARTIGSLLRSVSSAVIYGVAFVMVLAELGVNIAPIIASAGVLGLAVGFGAQSLVQDFLSGIFMMLEDQYGVGDWVDAGEASGEVEAVSLRVTTLRDLGGTVWYVRNGEIVRIGNYSQGFGVAVVDVPLAHHADTTQASRLANQAAEEIAAEYADDVLEAPTMLGVQSVTPYGVILRLTIKAKPGRQWTVQRALNARVQAILTANNVPAPNVPISTSTTS